MQAVAVRFPEIEAKDTRIRPIPVDLLDPQVMAQARAQDAAGRLPQAPTTVAGSLWRQLAELGVRQAFGVSGGAIGQLYGALADSEIELCHFRHETGAAFAAVEAHFASSRPVAVFATTGPGILNALTGVAAARREGAQLVLISGVTNASQRGRGATQETTSSTMPQDALFAKGVIFDYAVRMEDAAELPSIVQQLQVGFSRPSGFVAHVGVPMSLQKAAEPPPSTHRIRSAGPGVSPDDVRRCAELLQSGTFAVWVDFGARAAAPLVRELLDRSSARAFSSARGKGVVPETDPRFLGVTGLGGHQRVDEYMEQHKPDRLLVLGTRLGEATSFWDEGLLPSKGLVHVDLDSEAFGAAFPQFETLGIQAEIGAFLAELLRHFPKRQRGCHPALQRRSQTIPMRCVGRRPVRPRVLIDAVQRHVVRDSDAPVLAECGNSFAWCNHYLRFDTPSRYRVSTHFGSMGHVAAGVVGAALANRKKAVAVVGDGSMLMNSEISTAVQYGVPAVWIVLNDAAYGMCVDGHDTFGLNGSDLGIPRVDFATYARALGAQGVTVETEDQVDDALAAAMAAQGPFIVDVRIDSTEKSPTLRRFESLLGQARNAGAGWESTVEDQGR